MKLHIKLVTILASMLALAGCVIEMEPVPATVPVLPTQVQPASTTLVYPSTPVTTPAKPIHTRAKPILTPAKPIATPAKPITAPIVTYPVNVGSQKPIVVGSPITTDTAKTKTKKVEPLKKVPASTTTD